MTKYQLTFMHVGPERWRWAVSRIEADEHLTAIQNGVADSRAKAEELARAWATWHHDKLDRNETERIVIELP